MNRSFSLPFLIMGVVFCVCLICSNLLEVKMISLGGITATAGLIVFPISYIINDCIAEVWGYRKARLIIWLGFLMNLMAVIFIQIAIILPSAPFWDGQKPFETVFSSTPRILLASFIAFLVGSFLNAYVMSKMKISSKGKHFFITSHYIDRSGRKCRFALVFSYRIRWSSSCKRTIDSHCNTSLP